MFKKLIKLLTFILHELLDFKSFQCFYQYDQSWTRQNYRAFFLFYELRSLVFFEAVSLLTSD